jgi:hypothetical protein
MTKGKVRGRWAPSPEQIELVIDCATAKVPLEKAAELVGVKPRTVRIFSRRIGRPFPACVGRSGTGKTAAPASPRPGRRFLMAAHRRRAGQGASLAPRVMCRPWRGRVYLGGKHCHLGYFSTRDEAVAAHAAAVKAHLGETYLKARAQP